MEILRRLAEDAPAASTFTDSKPTLLLSWWCTLYAITIIIFRVCGRYIRVEKLFIEDTIMVVSIVVLLARMGLAHGIMLHGTNNVQLDGLSMEDISAREIGSQLVLGSRILYAAYLWTIKVSASLFLTRLTAQFWSTASTSSSKATMSRKNIQRYLAPCLWTFLSVTFVATILSTLTECQPFDHYWQVMPDPGSKCRQSYGQLLTFSSANILTDLGLIVFPLPMLFRARIPRKTKLSLSILLSLPIICVAFTSFRLVTVLDRNSSQQYRTLTASVDMLVATIVSNALVVMTFLQDKGLKKIKYKYRPEVTPALVARPTTKHDVMVKRWGSDEDLMRDDDDHSNGDRRLTLVGSASDDRDIELAEIKKPGQATLKPLGTIMVRTSWEVDSSTLPDSPTAGKLH